MPSIVKTLRVVADPNRLRILLLLKGEELSVAELQEILTMGQSTISTHLSQLKQAGLVEDRRTGKSNLYRASSTDGGPLDEILARAKAEIPEAAPDQAAMRSVLRKRQDKMRSFFDSVAGRLGKDYVPGQSWKGVAEALLRLMPPMVIADLGAGEGAFTLLLAQRAKKVIAVDTSAKMIEVGRDQALRHGVDNVEFRLGDMEEIPIADEEVDLVFFSQSLHHALHPGRAIEEAARILVPGGRIVLLDLAKHRFEEARELYADEWLGFSEAELEAMLEKAGFTDVQTSVVHKEPESPQFQTLLAVANKPTPSNASTAAARVR
jgi:ArsR family transcriptional regulator